MNFSCRLAVPVLLSSLFVVAGCSSTPPTLPVQAQTAPASLPRGAQPPQTKSTGIVPAAAPAATAERTQSQTIPAAPEPRLADRISSQLEPAFIVTEISPSSLLVKKKVATPVPSLYEESIALSRLRGQLKSKADLPPDTARRTSLRNGSADIPLPGTIAPSAAAGIVSSALALDGVQKVRVVLTPAR